MTIEIRELIIEARVVKATSESLAPAVGVSSLGRGEQERLIELIVRRVLEKLYDEREEM
ncbi:MULTISPECIES: DUF5908 family protein [unclassified Burkholderia]|uniref:DUF5908 family protein n=1 Tax=unclassified Burkholderia TaxID=2613784 RepID=UPI0012E3432E|nr:MULTISPECIES: DUF5908 family protein [unclassified Burkholderia]